MSACRSVIDSPGCASGYVEAVPTIHPRACSLVGEYPVGVCKRNGPWANGGIGGAAFSPGRLDWPRQKRQVASIGRLTKTSAGIETKVVFFRHIKKKKESTKEFAAKRRNVLS